MLKFIRKNAGALWVKSIFGLIAVIFVGWGVAGNVSSGNRTDDVVATVNDEKINSTEYRRAHDNLYRLYENIYKDNFKPELAKMLDLKNKAMDQLIRVALLRQEAERLGLRAGDTEVANAIAEMKAFQAESGGFDKELYIRILRANRLSPGEFEKAQREELVVNKVQDLVTSAVHVTEAEALERYRFENDKVSLKFLKFDATAFTGEVQVSDDEVQKHYDANQEKFRAPDKVRVDYVHYPNNEFGPKVQISDAELQAFYDTHPEEFAKPEQVSARHILLKVDSSASDEKKAEVRKRAEELLAKAKAGEDFAALAKANSEDEGSAAKGGDLGTFGRHAMVKPFEEAAFALNPGEISEIVESTFGLHIIKVENKIPAGTLPFDEVKQAVVDKVRIEKQRVLAREQAYADHGKAETGQGLAEIAAASGLKLESPEPFAQNDSPPGLGHGPLPNAAFAAEVGKVGPVVDTPTGFYLFVVKEKIASHIPPLTEIRDSVEKAARAVKAEAAAKAKAEAALAALQLSKDIEAVGKSFQVEVDETTDFSRQGTYVAKIGSAPDLKKAAFKLTPEQPVASAVYEVSGSSYVAVLKGTSPADEEKFKTDKDNLIRQTEDRRKQQALEEFVNYLKARANIEMNQEFLASVPDSGRLLGAAPRGQQ